MVTLSVLHVFVEYVEDTESIYAFKKKMWGVDLQHTIGSLSNKDKRHLKSEFELLQTSETLSRIFHLVQLGKCWQSFLEMERLPSKLRNRKSLSCVHVHHETWNKAFSGRTRTVTAKKSSKKARSTCRVLLPIQTHRIPFCRSRWRRSCPTTTTTMTSKNNRFYDQNNSSARASRFLVHFFDVHCTTATWNLLMRRYMEDVDIRRQISLSLFQHG